MITTHLPSQTEMYDALVRRDATYDGVFVIAVKTTGIFCRPTCPARKPKRDNVEFFASVSEALSAGYRACKRCQPLAPSGKAPAWLQNLLEAIERDPSRRWTDDDLRAMEIEPSRVRRWFRQNHGMTFHAYQRARRLGLAMGRIRHGEDLTRAAFDHGYESVSGFREAFAQLFGDAPGRSRGSDIVTVNRLLTPLGPMVAGAVNDGICLLEFADRRMLETQFRRLQRHFGSSIVPGDHEHIGQLSRELAGYFDGTLREFGVPLVLPGTEFQQQVWNRLLRIPFGKTLSYQRLAHDIGRPGAQRAVGRANGDNRLAIVIPCHRVVRSNGEMCGYGGGLWRKRLLLEHEHASFSVNPSDVIPSEDVTASEHRAGP